MSDDKILGTEDNLEENLLKFANSFDDAKEKVWEVIVFGLNKKRNNSINFRVFGGICIWDFWLDYISEIFVLIR